MELLVLILIVFGIAPTLFAPIFSVWSQKRLLNNARYQQYKAKFKRPTVPNTFKIPRGQLDGSAMQAELPGVQKLNHTAEPQFSTLHCRSNQISEAKWRLEIEFEIRNQSSDREIVIDDIHACLYESDAFAPPYLTISYFGDVLLRQDNRIFKETRIYSLAPRDGSVMNLLFEATRVEGAPAYGVGASEKEGRAVAVFGLLLDYYVNTPSGLDRRSIPSDCLYLFSSYGPVVLRAINQEKLSELKSSDFVDQATQSFFQRVEDYLVRHTSFREIPGN